MCSRLDTTVFGVPTLPFCVRSPSFRNVGVRQQGGICKTFRGAFVRVELAGIEPASLSFVQDGFTQVETITAPP
jgi:hypothetical protein